MAPAAVHNAVIACVRVDRYEEELLLSAVSRQFSLIGLADTLRPGLRVLIKPNLITAKKPDSGAVTHPALVRAIALWLREQGVTDITIADSPGGPHAAANLRAVYAAAGYQQLSDVARLSFDTAWETVSAPDGTGIRAFNFIAPAIEADLIINVCKLKTHGMMGISAGVKNLFGLIPGLQKPEMHFRLPGKDEFADMLIDLCLTAGECVTIVDAIDAMEGNGPTSGTVRHYGHLFASRDAFSLDNLLCRLMGFDPESLAYTNRMRLRGLVDDNPDIVGDLPEKADPPFRAPDSMKLDFTGSVPARLKKPFLRVANALIKPYPFVDAKKCIGCGKCKESCPPRVIAMENKKAVIDRGRCISCFCCQEMCPAHAIDARRRLRR